MKGVRESQAGEEIGEKSADLDDIQELRSDAIRRRCPGRGRRKETKYCPRQQKMGGQMEGK